MEVKFTKKLTDYKYVAMFDLASKQSGFCLFDIVTKKPLYTQKVVVNHVENKPFTIDLEMELEKLFLFLQENFQASKENTIFVTEAMPTQVSSRSSTIQTFLALAKSHAIFDHYLYKNNFHQYDLVGIYPATTHSYFKQLLQVEKDYKVSKDDIKKYVMYVYGLDSKISYDEADATFLALTFVERKWNNDLDEKIREIKRHKKELKMKSAIAELENEIIKFQSYKI